MKLDTTLLPWPYHAQRDGVKPLRLVWDSERGTVSGSDAQRVLERIQEPAGTPFIVSLRTAPESQSISDPLHKPEEMAVLLGAMWMLPPELEALYPMFDELPEDLLA